jgi:hypothetical protein
MGFNDRLILVLQEAEAEANLTSAKWSRLRDFICKLAQDAIDNSLKNKMDEASVRPENGGVLLFVRNNGTYYELWFKLDKETSRVLCTSTINSMVDEIFNLDSMDGPTINGKILDFAVKALRGEAVTDPWRVVK